MGHENSQARGNLSEPEIKSHMRSDAVQHPAALLPLAVSAMSVIYLLVLSPVFGGGSWAIVLLVTSGTVAAAAFTWRYTSRYSIEYATWSRGFLELQDQERERLERAEVTQLYETLRSSFMSIGSTRGLKACDHLADEYELLQPALTHGSDNDPLSLSHLPALAWETYRRGLKVLSDAVELMNATNAPERERLLAEIAELKRDIDANKEDGSEAERLRIREETLSSNRQLVEMLGQLRFRVDQLLHQAGRCEAALHYTRFELAAVRAGSSQTRVDSVIDALERSIHQAKEVQEELKRFGY